MFNNDIPVKTDRTASSRGSGTVRLTATRLGAAHVDRRAHPGRSRRKRRLADSSDCVEKPGGSGGASPPGRLARQDGREVPGLGAVPWQAQQDAGAGAFGGEPLPTLFAEVTRGDLCSRLLRTGPVQLRLV